MRYLIAALIIGLPLVIMVFSLAVWSFEKLMP